jgi:hypothetical protein
MSTHHNDKRAVGRARCARQAHQEGKGRRGAAARLAGNL